MESKRTISRIKAGQILYIMELTNQGYADAKKAFDEEIDDFCESLVLGVVDKKTEIDELISNCLVNYTLNRLNLVDKQIIRVATYELLLKEVPFEIVINEAVLITKKYSDLDDNKSSSFNNRLLDNICKYLGYK